MLSPDGKKSTIILSVLTVFATTFFILRVIFTKQTRSLGTDDWLLAFALLMLYVQDAGALLLVTKGGVGKPMKSLTPDEIEWLLKMFFWPALGYTILISTIKFSILWSYKRIFEPIRWFRIACYLLITLTAMWFIGVFFSVLFQCTPVDKAWKPLKPGHCIDFVPFLWGNSVSNNILDYLILLLPVVPVWQLQMGKSQKALLLGSFALGSVACVAGTLRAAATSTVDVTDLSQSVYEASIWTYIEPSVGIMGACLPFLARIFRQRLLEMLNVISTFGSRTTSLLRPRSKPATSTRGTVPIGNELRRAGHEEHEMFGDENSYPAFSKTSGVTSKAESLRTLV